MIHVVLFMYVPTCMYVCMEVLCLHALWVVCIISLSIQQEHPSYHARVILCLAQEGFAPKDLITLPTGISLLIQDCVTKCQYAPPTNWPVTAYDIIGR